MTTNTLWQRLDVPGHDACRLIERDEFCELSGTAVFVDAIGGARIDYFISCTPDWRFRYGSVRGWIGERAWQLDIRRSDAGEWMLNSDSCAGLADCLDLDLGFTPSTNVLHLRRAGLGIGESAEIPVAWLDLPDPSLVRLPQLYERRSDRSYWYESPTANYAALLEMGASGFVAEYPGLWRMLTEESSPGTY